MSSGYGMLSAVAPQPRLPTPWEQPISPYEQRPRFDDPVATTPTPYALPPYTPQQPAVPELDMGDYAKAGVKGFFVPHVVGGVAAGAIAAYGLRGTGLSGAAFAGRVIGGAMSGVAAGAATGAIVSMTDPEPGDSLQKRFGITGAILGGVTGAMTSPGSFRPVGMALGALTGGLIGSATGTRLQPRLEATA